MYFKIILGTVSCAIQRMLVVTHHTSRFPCGRVCVIMALVVSSVNHEIFSRTMLAPQPRGALRQKKSQPWDITADVQRVAPVRVKTPAEQARQGGRTLLFTQVLHAALVVLLDQHEIENRKLVLVLDC